MTSLRSKVTVYNIYACMKIAPLNKVCTLLTLRAVEAIHAYKLSNPANVRS